MSIPALNLYSKFGNPYRLAEFRIFSFNNCGAGCKNCFYQKTNNNYLNFQSVLTLAKELRAKDYSLETCYLLPTDVFENDFNYRIFDDADLREVLNMFNYVGLASTLRNGFDQAFFHRLLTSFPHLKIELHVNLLEDQIGSPEYAAFMKQQFLQLKEHFGDRILANLALNTGTALDEKKTSALKELVQELSHDNILEINFTFLFNSKMDNEKKATLLRQSYPILQDFTKEFARNEQAYNSRTLLRKPSFVFKDNQVFLSPIIPFDEYVFIDGDDFKLKAPTFESFIDTFARVEANNTPLWNMCEACSSLEVCHGKGFFSLARHFDLQCIKRG